jgi:hypothetical protein
MPERSREVREKSLLVPGREDASMYPPVGKLDLDRITSMSDEELDVRLGQHLEGASPLKNPHYRDAYPERRRVVKRIFLALLEGHPPSGSAVSEWLVSQSGTGELAVSRLSIRALLEQIGSQSLKKRLRDVRSNILNDVRFLQPSKEVLLSLAEINQEMKRYGLEKFTLESLMRPDTLSKSAMEHAKYGAGWTDVKLLQLFRLYLDRSISLASLGERFGGLSENNISVIRNRYFTKNAREVSRNIRYNKIPLMK